MNLEKTKMLRLCSNPESQMTRSGIPRPQGFGIANDAKRSTVSQLAAPWNYELRITNCKSRMQLFPRRMLTLLLLSFVLLSSSCVRNKNFILLQTQEPTTDSTFYTLQRGSIYKIQYNDVLKIDIKSFDVEATKLFNAFEGNARMNGIIQNGDPYYMFGYTVDDSGYVELPVIGKILLVDLTTDQAKLRVQAEVDRYFAGAYVSVNIGGVRFAVLGEVNRPGKYVVLQNRLTILEALANAGDLNAIANRKEVRIIRQYPTGSEVITLDLTRRDLMTSPHYLIRPNDLIYVQPLKVREFGTGVTGQQTLSTVLASMSLILNSILIYNTLVNLNR
jgi:polysaccharide export outer membrane protein